MVAADTRARAEDALEAIEVDYEALAASSTIAAAADPAAAPIYEELGSNVAWEGHVSYGDVEGAFARADRVVRERLEIHRYSSTPLEPFACVAHHTPELLTIWCNSQSPDVIYEAITEALGIDAVRVIVPDVGGGFGQKIHLIRKYAVLTALMAVKTGRPVKWIEDRSEHMMAGGHSCEQEFDVQAAVKADGEVLGLKVQDTDDVGGSISTLTIHFTNKLNNLFNTYKVKHLRLDGRSVLTNKCPVVPNRGIGKPGMCFVWERIMDRIAQDLSLDPLAVRRRNLIGANEFPYTTPNGNIYGSGDYQTLLDKVLVNVDYDGVRRRQTEARASGRTGVPEGRLSASGSSSASSPADETPPGTWRSFLSRSRCRAPVVSRAPRSSWRRTARSYSRSGRRVADSRMKRRRARSSPMCSAPGRSGSRSRRRSTRRDRRGVCRRPTAATTSISTTSAPCTARRRVFERRCSRWPRTC